MTIEELIIETVINYFGISEASLKWKGQRNARPDISNPKFIVTALIIEKTGYSRKKIGKCLGVDHSTINYRKENHDLKMRFSSYRADYEYLSAKIPNCYDDNLKAINDQLIEKIKELSAENERLRNQLNMEAQGLTVAK